MKTNSKAPVFCNFQKRRKETEFLTCVLAAGNKQILNHPLSEAFLTLKWLRVWKFFWASLLFQIALVLLFTVFVMEVYVVQQRPYFNETSQTSPPDMDRSSRILNDTNPCDPNESDNGPEIKIQPPKSVWSWFRITTEKRKDDSGTREKYKHNQKNNTSGDLTWILKLRDNITEKRNDTKGGWGRARRLLPIIGQNSSEEILNTDFESEKDENMQETEMKEEACEKLWLAVIWGLLIAFTSLMAIKEIFQFLQAPLSYIFSSENWGQWALIVSVILTSWCKTDFIVANIQYPAAACGIFLAWGLMLLQVGRFPALGLYVQMLGKVAANFGVFILAYACLLIAFALAFSVLYGPDHPPYPSLPKTILKVLTMMVGEVDYEDLFYPDDPSKNIPYPITAHIFHGAFVVLCTVVLMNLLVGLAVHDIQGLQKRAKLNRLSSLESFIFSKRLQTCLPRSIGAILQESALLVPSSYKWSYYIRPNDPRDQRLPKDLKMAALRLAATRHAAKRATKPRQTAFRSRKISSSNEIDIKRIE